MIVLAIINIIIAVGNVSLNKLMYLSAVLSKTNGQSAKENIKSLLLFVFMICACIRR